MTSRDDFDDVLAAAQAGAGWAYTVLWTEYCRPVTLPRQTGRHATVEHIALAVTSITDDLAPRILSQLGIAPAQAHAALRDRYGRAGCAPSSS